MNNSKKNIALILLMVVVGMFAFAYAMFPLYSIFCKVTGYGGTTQTVSKTADVQIVDRVIKVRFNADISKNLPWKFEPVEKEVEVKLGEKKLVNYIAKNLSNVTTKGTATYNVTPNEAGEYFNKISCFCFTEQEIKAGQEVEMPVLFYIDPAIMQDESLKDIDTITLSYTFFEVK